ncbi:exodeoxyribonuclease VII small subunit [Desulfotomaculum copahuensis]|uniref:Exodeoxyribonuclease 7 small subunit n=1 Tax=Desulfotomaculum copahuensis TaxID=1838280 RepID=A0A1B7LIW5_9FIRM|nr:exodeoxyribonuclease VII small subunit [Desulfotomaculum copahuensis]OAT86520.1 exodeoxyribonuclease VII small subunit [Desulfotomaculum copahuensis]
MVEKNQNQTFEEALARLEAVVRELEDGQLPLEKSLALFGEGITLSRFCQQQLEQAEQRISILTADENGELVLKDAGACLADLTGVRED